MKFIKLDLSSIKEVKEYFDTAKLQTCDFTVGGMYMWRDYYNMEYCIENRTFYSRLYDKNGQVFYNLPLAKDIREAIRKLIDEVLKTEQVIKFITIPEHYKNTILEMYSNIVIKEQIDYFDYFYNIDDLVLLKGKKYSTQRNFINNFTKKNTNWVFKGIEKSMIGDIIDFLKENFSFSNGNTEEEENIKVLEILEKFDIFHFYKYKVLYLNNKIIGFIIGEVIGDTLFIHVEKANKAFVGVYQFMFWMFLKEYSGKTIKYVNREEDMGNSGLRKSKLAYRPISMLKKYIIEVSE